MAKKTEIMSMDDALDETKFGKFNYMIIFISAMIMINVVLECVGISFVLPVINCDMNLSFQKKGILGAVSFLGMISSSHLWGFLADTTGRRNVIRPTLIVGYFVSAISSLSPNFWTFVVLRYINGFLLCGGSATIFAYLGEFHCNKLRNRAIMASAFISAATAILLPVSAWVVINQNWSYDIPFLDLTYKPWRLYIGVIGTIGLLCGISLFYIPESPKYLLCVGKEEAAIKVLKKMYAINTGNSRESFEITSIKPDNEEIQRFKVKNGKSASAIVKLMWNQTIPLFLREHCKKTLLSCFIQFWLFYAAHGFYMWFPFILNKVMLYTKLHPDARLEICEIVYSMQETVMTNATFVEKSCSAVLESSTYEHTLALEFIYLGVFLGTGYFIGKFGRTPNLFIVLFMCGACGALSAVVTVPIIAVYLQVILLLCGIATSVVNIIVVDIYPTNLRAMAVCISLMLGRIGSVTGTNVVGILIEDHCKISLLTASVPLIICAFLSLLLPNGEEPKKKKITNDLAA
ncbi:synaptic vesicle glycoprotein 2B-like [Eupeodes corollae]|uniref:synaptic vesicle glycoprotein 2B-like n=1 Tax=Eupeodes corollae TaxID=290404 RepID=UPI002490F60B|nr:synaptic vesicle glycoprotein 2B-like [Eupeodes corollae]XP_055913355.1 synaptic vesicle glycoprotein 2B-like [Eupeodes corollae]